MLVIYNSTNRSYLSLNIVISCIHTIYLSLSLYIYIYIYIYILFDPPPRRAGVRGCGQAANYESGFINNNKSPGIYNDNSKSRDYYKSGRTLWLSAGGLTRADVRLRGLDFPRTAWIPERFLDSGVFVLWIRGTWTGRTAAQRAMITCKAKVFHHAFAYCIASGDMRINHTTCSGTRYVQTAQP